MAGRPIFIPGPVGMSGLLSGNTNGRALARPCEGDASARLRGWYGLTYILGMRVSLAETDRR